MSIALSPTVRQITAQVAVVLSHDPEARAIGIRASRPGEWPDRVNIGERDFELAWCPSPLAVRERLTALEQEGAGKRGLVVLTPLADEKAVGLDVLARLARARIFSIDSWEMVGSAFQAKDIDARLAKSPWVADILLERMPPGGYPPVAGGYLDADTAWGHVLRETLGITSARPDLPSVLQWSCAGDAGRRYTALSESARRQIEDWLADVLGPAGRLVVACLQAGTIAELLPLAWICGILFDEKDKAPARPELLQAAVRLERFTGGVPVRPTEGLLLHRAAVQLAAVSDPAVLHGALEYGDQLVNKLHLGEFAHLSEDLPSGLNARLEQFGEAVSSYLENSGRQAVLEVEAAAEGVRAHRLAARFPLRLNRVEMAVRLVRWLQRDQAEAAGLRDVVRGFAADGSFVDWARAALSGGDELHGLSAAYSSLAAAVRGRRDELNKAFATKLRNWNAEGCPELDGVVPLERVLQDVVGPIAAKDLVLLLVVDGLSYGIFRELLEDAIRQGWNEVLPAGRDASSVGLAAIPSVTEVSRASLLCGRLTVGQSSHEKQAFSRHPALTASSRSSAKPQLFHKGELSEGGALSPVVREAVGTRDCRVVGVVFNGVDDHLSGADQLVTRWTLDDLRLIKPLLFEARTAGRVVVLTADHGHVLEEATAVRTGGVGDRWRKADSPAGEGELLFQGGRVLTADGDQQVIAPWTETVRYGGKKNGYHGGVSLQELVIPVCVMTAGASAPAGYEFSSPVVPEWWLGHQEEVPVQSPQPRLAKTPRKKAPNRLQNDLFGADELPEPPVVEEVRRDWIDDVLSSPVFDSQRQLAARAALSDQQLRALLSALGERGGKISKAALAQRLGMPLMRVSGFINSARRLLNVDQQPVLSLDEAEGTVVLNRELLSLQFKEER